MLIIEGPWFKFQHYLVHFDELLDNYMLSRKDEPGTNEAKTGQNMFNELG